MRVAVVLAVLLSSLATPLSSRAEGKAKSGHAVLMMPADIKWADVPGAAGVQMAAVQGDPSKGGSHFFLKFTPGFSAPLHHHSADHYGTVVTGVMTLTLAGKETRLGPGSYWAFTGKAKHSTKCEAGADCVIFIDARSKWDVVPAKAEKEQARK